MRPLCVVPHTPRPTEFTDLIERREHPGVENFVPVTAIESFDVGVLVRLAWLNEQQFDAVLRAPRPQQLRHELGPVLTAETARGPMHGHQLVQHRDDALTGSDTSTSIAKASRLPSSKTLKMR